MAQRAFKYFSIVAGGTPQPLIGTKLTAAITPSAVGTIINVADSSMFNVGDWAMLDSPGALEERQLVLAVPSSTSITVSKVLNAHANGAWARLGNDANSILIQSLDGNAAALYVGTSPAMVKATGVFVIAKIQNVTVGTQPTYLSFSKNGPFVNIDSVGQLWIDGNTGDQYLPSLGVA